MNVPCFYMNKKIWLEYVAVNGNYIVNADEHLRQIWKEANVAYFNVRVLLASVPVDARPKA
jgi:hypothetical protein